jgi:hypothetical protein
MRTTAILTIVLTAALLASTSLSGRQNEAVDEEMQRNLSHAEKSLQPYLGENGSEKLISEMPNWYKEWVSAYQKTWWQFWQPIDEQFLPLAFDGSLSTSEKLAIQGSFVLKGVTAVRPQVMFLDPDRCVPGLTLKELQAAVEAHLSRLGVTLTSNPMFPSLTVSVTVLRYIRPGTYDVRARAALQEQAILARSPHPHLMPVTSWQGCEHATVLEKLPTKGNLLDIANESLDEFIKSYLLANRREPPDKQP